MLNFKKESTKKLNEIGVIDLQYSRIDGKPIFKIDIDKIEILKKYFFIELINFLEDHRIRQTFNGEYYLKATDFTTNFKRILKLNKLNENR
jgi:hypothetical protein